MRQILSQRRLWIAAIIAVMVSLSGVFAWSPLNCWHQDVDIYTGRIRHVRMLAFCTVSTHVEETWLSKNSAIDPDRADWRRVNTFSPGMRYSPHYQFHDAIHQIKTLELLDDLAPFAQTERRTIAATMISKWQSGSTAEAASYVHAVSESR